MPILATLRGWKYGFNSPFKAEVYFVSTRKFTDLKWGTPGPAMMRDKDFGMVRVTSFGIYSIRAKDAGIIVRDLVGTEGRFTVEQVQENLRGKIGLRIKELMPELGIPVIEMSAKVYEMGTKLHERLQPDFEALGLELVEVQVQDIGLPEEVEKAIDKRGAMAAVGDLRAYTQYETGIVHPRCRVSNPGGAAGAGMGLGAGIAMGAQMMNSMCGRRGASAARRGAAADSRAPRSITWRRARRRPVPSTWRAAAAGRDRARSIATRSCGRTACRNGPRRATCPSSRRSSRTFRRRFR